MFCSNCGKKLENGIRHCPYCGAKIRQSAETSDAKQESAASDMTAPIGRAGRSAAREGSLAGVRKGKLLLAAGAAGLLLILFLLLKLITGGRTVNALDYM